MNAKHSEVGHTQVGVGGSDLVQVFIDMLAGHPQSVVAAIRDDGILVPMPASVPLDGHRVAMGRSLLDMVVPGDKLEVITTWERSRADGGASAIVHLSTDPEQPVLVMIVDAVARFGAHLALITPADGTGEHVTNGSFAGTAMPRTARVRKNGLAIITEVDHATTQILGWQPDQIIGRRSLEFIHPEDQERAMSNWMEMLTSPGHGQRVRLRHLTADGGWVWMEFTNHNHLDDDEPSVLAEMLDISEELAAQEALRASEQRLRRLAEALPLGVLRIERDRHISYSNERIAAITGVETCASIDAQFEHVVPEDGARLVGAIDAVLDGDDQDIAIRFRVPTTTGSAVRHCMISMRAMTSVTGRVTDAIVSVADVSEQVQMTAELEHRATYDALTGCLNRPSLMTRLDAMLLDPGAGVALVFIDLDGFKAINDEHGHAAGDAVLAHVGVRLHSAVRSGDLVGRVGGDEFVVVCRDIGDGEGALSVGAEIDAALEVGVITDGDLLVVRASLGVAHTNDPTTSSDRLIAEADARMYDEKRSRQDGTIRLCGALDASAALRPI